MKNRTPFSAPLSFALLPLLGGLLFAAPPIALAEDELPPSKPKASYHARYEIGYTHEQADEQGANFSDLVTVWVSGSRLRQESRTGYPAVSLLDAAKGEMLEFDPEDEERTAARSEPDTAPLLYLEGSSVFEDLGAPQAIGIEQVAGQACTLLQFGNPQEEGAMACVTKDGIVARAELHLPGLQRRWKASEIEIGDQPDRHFELPKGFRVDDE